MTGNLKTTLSHKAKSVEIHRDRESVIVEISTAVLAGDLYIGISEYGMDWIKAYRKQLKNKS